MIDMNSSIFLLQYGKKCVIKFDARKEYENFFSSYSKHRYFHNKLL